MLYGVELWRVRRHAALGQLTASVAHEINTPLGVIRGASTNIAAAFSSSLQQLPCLWPQLSAQQQSDFLALIQDSQQQQQRSTRAERQLRRQLEAELTSQGLETAETLAAQLALLGLSATQPYASLLQHPKHLTILEAAYSLVLQHRHTQSIQQEVDRAAKIVFALKTYSHQDYAAEKTLASLTDGIEVALTLYQHRLRQGIEVIRDYRDSSQLLCNPDQLTQVWVNLVDNAIYAMNQQGTLEISVFQQDEQMVVELTDSGCGIPAELAARVFEPFFTTKPQGEGSGLGLDIVRQIIEKHGGQIGVCSQSGRTRFTIQLPLLAAGETP